MLYFESFKDFKFEFPKEWDTNIDSIINFKLNTNKIMVNNSAL